MRRAMRGKSIILLCALCFFLSVLMPVSAESSASSRRTVRVGIADAGGSETAASDNQTVRFEKEYIEAVAEYAGWDCEYVKASWAQCLEMAKSGEIDVLTDVSKTEERMQYFDYSEEPMGTELCTLISTKDTQLRYDDYQSFNGITIGYEQGSIIIDVFRQYAKSEGFSFQEKGYESAADMYEALEQGGIDAAVQTNMLGLPSGYVILAECSPSPVYIVTSRKIPELKGELDSAMTKLFNYNPNFNADIYRSVYKNNVIQSEQYSSEEQAYLDTHPEVTVPYETDWYPFEYERSGEPAGITPDVIRAIGEDTGINFRFVKSSSTQAIYSGMGSLAGDTVMAVSCSYLWASSHDLLVTMPYVSGSVMRVTKASMSSPQTAAVVAGGYLQNEIRNTYPELKETEYQTFDECVKAVADGRADCTFLNYYQANYYRSLGDYDTLSYKPVENITQSIGLGVTKDSNPLLLGILSKALTRISASRLQSILSKDSVQVQSLSFKVLARRYPVQVSSAVAITIGLIAFMAWSIVSARNKERQNIILAEAEKKAQAANIAKSDFLSRMSHDMRTPLNGIIGMTYLARKQDNCSKTEDCLDKIDLSSKFLLGLINDVLDMAKAESGAITLKPEPYPVGEFEQYIDAVIRPLCADKNQKLIAEISMPEGCTPLADKLKMNQIAFNLLSNAVKYSPEGSEITYRDISKLQSDGRIQNCIEVIDHGIGMSEEFQKVLFEPFSQENRIDNSEMRGTGLGLTITKKLVDAMGGTIEVKSSLGRGTEIRVVLLLDRADESTEQNGLQAASSARTEEMALLAGRHVLLCEDNAMNQEIARDLLNECGLIVEVANDGAEGVKQFAASAPGFFSAVLMDIRMPVMNGYEAARAIRGLSRPDAKTVPIIAMTADAYADDVQQCLDAGMNAHLAKPIDPDGMLKVIAGEIGRACASATPGDRKDS